MRNFSLALSIAICWRSLAPSMTTTIAGFTSSIIVRQLCRPVVIVVAHKAGRDIAAGFDDDARRRLEGVRQAVAETAGEEVADDQDLLGILQFLDRRLLCRDRRGGPRRSGSGSGGRRRRPFALLTLRRPANLRRRRIVSSM